eukprot:5889887-Pleurochrysis_carterae.AAC.6
MDTCCHVDIGAKGCLSEHFPTCQTKSREFFDIVNLSIGPSVARLRATMQKGTARAGTDSEHLKIDSPVLGALAGSFALLSSSKMIIIRHTKFVSGVAAG